MANTELAASLKKIHEDLLDLVVSCKDCPFPMKEIIIKAINWVFLSEGGGAYGSWFVDDIQRKFSEITSALELELQQETKANPDIPFPLLPMRSIEKLRENLISSVMACGDCPVPMADALKEAITAAINESINSSTAAKSAEFGKLIVTGYGSSLSEAFDNAVALLPEANPVVVDGYVVYKIIEQGKYRGGIAQHEQSYAKVKAVFDTDHP